MFTVILNGKQIYEYEAKARLPGHQRQFLDDMDRDMDQGISLGGEQIEMPDAHQRLKYVVFKLIQGIEDSKSGLVKSTSAYLGSRQAGLIKIIISQQDEKQIVSLEFDNERVSG